MNTSTLVSSAEEEQQLPSAETMARQIVNNVLKTLIKTTMHVCVSLSIPASASIKEEQNYAPARLCVAFRPDGNPSPRVTTPPIL